MTHEDKVRRIAAMVRAASRAGIPVKFRRRSVPHFVPNPFKEGDDRPTIDISDLTEVLRIDPGSRLCVAESGVPFTDLVAATLSHGLIPCTVPELKTITVGGAVSGCSVESMSYKLGGFHDSCLEYEVITGTGEILTCSPDHDRDAFEMIHGSYGTVALLTKLTFRLLPAKPFVRMEYRRCSTFDRFWAEVCARCERDDFDFVDGIVHSPSQLVVCLGRMVDEAPYLSSYDWLEVYYKSTLARQEDYLRLPDYFFRYDTECHWLSRSVPVLHLEHKAVRFLLGKLLLGSTNLIRWHDRLRRLMRLKRRPEVIVDVFIPVPRFPAFWQWY